MCHGFHRKTKVFLSTKNVSQKQMPSRGMTREILSTINHFKRRRPISFEYSVDQANGAKGGNVPSCALDRDAAEFQAKKQSCITKKLLFQDPITLNLVL